MTAATEARKQALAQSATENPSATRMRGRRKTLAAAIVDVDASTAIIVLRNTLFQRALLVSGLSGESYL